MTAEQRRLVLIRHAKATPGGSPDIDRPLAPRGLRDARAIGLWIAENGPALDRAVVSPALRTRQTWDTLAAQLARAPEPATDDRIYANTVGSLLDVLRGIDGEATTLAMVGHNPSIHALAALLDDQTGRPRLRAALQERYPTSAVSVFKLAVGWTEIDAATAELVAFEIPRG